MNTQEYFAHDSAIIDEPCLIGKGTKIWHFSHIMANCSMGENCNIGQNVVISPDVHLGKNVKVQNNVSIYTGVNCDLHVLIFSPFTNTPPVEPRSRISKSSSR